MIKHHDCYGTFFYFIAFVDLTHLINLISFAIGGRYIIL
jgi:hypothetical protein